MVQCYLWATVGLRRSYTPRTSVKIVYDKDVINDYKKMVKNLTQFDALKATYYLDPEELEDDWQTLLKSDIPFLKK